MANSKSHNGAAIINQTPLIAFGLQHGNIGFGREKNSEGKEYSICMFIQPNGTKTRVTVADKLQGEIKGTKESMAADAAFIKENIRGLQVVEFEVSDELREERKANGRQPESYQLCRDGQEVHICTDIDFAALAGM